MKSSTQTHKRGCKIGCKRVVGTPWICKKCRTKANQLFKNCWCAIIKQDQDKWVIKDKRFLMIWSLFSKETLETWRMAIQNVKIWIHNLMLTLKHLTFFPVDNENERVDALAKIRDRCRYSYHSLYWHPMPRLVLWPHGNATSGF